MSAITPSALLPFLDAIGGTYYNSDDAARYSALVGLLSDLPGTATSDLLGLVEKVGPGLTASQTAGQPDQVTFRIIDSLMLDLEMEMSVNGGSLFQTIGTWAAYQNGLTPYSALLSPHFALLYWLFLSQGNRTPSQLLPASAVFSPVTGLGSATVGAGGAVTFTGAAGILTVSDLVGGTQGYAPAKSVTATGTAAVSGSEVLHVTYNGWSALGVPFTGHVGTLDVSSLALGATTATGAWTPAATGERISKITAIAASGSPTATSGGFTLQTTLDRSAP